MRTRLTDAQRRPIDQRSQRTSLLVCAFIQDRLLERAANSRRSIEMRSAGHVSKLTSVHLRIRSSTILLVAAGCASFLLILGSGTAVAQDPSELRSPSELASIQDLQTRSRALFSEAAKVIMNPR